MSDDTVTVKLTLRKHVAERLRKMCHARSETASELVDRWIFGANDRGEQKPPGPPRPLSFEDIVAEARRARR